MASFSENPVASAPDFVVTPRSREATEEFQGIAPRYVAAGAVAAPLVALALFRFGFGGQFAIAALVIASLCVLAAIDITERRLPNRIVLPSAAVVLAAQTALYPDHALEWVLAAGGAALFLLLPLLVHRSAVGMGDVKLALLLGAALGSAVMTALVLASVAAAVYAAVLLMRGGAAARKSSIAFGPFLAFGAIVALLISELP
jgi:leader peptidase (prepilin peptidase)/N-methyltransferase